MNLEELKDKNVQVIGLAGAEGSGIALFLIQSGLTNIVGHDFSIAKEFKKNYLNYHRGQSLKTSQAQIRRLLLGLKKIHYSATYLNDLAKADVIFAPSSWFRYRINRPLSRIMKKKRLWCWYNLVLEHFKGTVVGVTGTAGKGTTTDLIYRILKASGRRVYLVGDSWQSFDLEKILSSPPGSFLVAELSNRTLTFANYSKKSPRIAVITNITRNHLEDHANSFAKYINAKKEVARYQVARDYFLLNSDDQISKKLKKFSAGKRLFYSSADPVQKLIANKNIFGRHLITDAIAAVKVAQILKISKKQIQRGLNGFKPRQGRMQYLRKINGVDFINDAASTRPEATGQAVKSFAPGTVHLILEGSRINPDKKQFLGMVKVARQCRVKNAAVSGQIAGFLLPLLNQEGIKAHKTKNLTESVKLLHRLAKPGEVVLLSPSCESFGQFKDYRERSQKFISIVNRLSC